jgi:hypothetical protein
VTSTRQRDLAAAGLDAVVMFVQDGSFLAVLDREFQRGIGVLCDPSLNLIFEQLLFDEGDGRVFALGRRSFLEIKLAVLRVKLFYFMEVDEVGFVRQGEAVLTQMLLEIGQGGQMDITGIQGVIDEVPILDADIDDVVQIQIDQRGAAVRFGFQYGNFHADAASFL